MLDAANIEHYYLYKINFYMGVDKVFILCYYNTVSRFQILLIKITPFGR